jgi:hypothetical protein
MVRHTHRHSCGVQAPPMIQRIYCIQPKTKTNVKQTIDNEANQKQAKREEYNDGSKQGASGSQVLPI